MYYLIFQWQTANTYKMYICKAASIQHALKIIDEPCIDYKFTTLTQEDFNALSLVDSGVISKLV